MATEYPWPTRPLGNAGTWLSGGTPSKDNPDFWSGTLPWVSPKDMKAARLGDAIDHVSNAAVGNGTRLVPSDTLLMVVRGMILAHTFPVALTTSEVTFNQDIKALQAAREFLPDFLLYWLQSRAAEILKLTDVANHGTRRLPTERLFALETPTPTLSEQRKIAAILSAVDEVIEKTEAVIESLQALKKAMMQELLTRGLPGRHTRFKQTEIGEVPEGWEVVPFGAVLKRGPDNGLYRPKEDYGTGTPIVRIDSFASGDTLPSGGYQRVRLCTDDVLRFRLSESEIVINRVNSLSHLAKAAYVGLLAEPTVFESNMMRVGVDSERVLPRFAFLWIASEMARTFFLARAKQAVAQASVNQQDVKTMPLPLPPFSEQETIVSTLDSLLERIETESVVLNNAQSTKQALMSVLLTGELRVTPDKDAA